ncbi:hypothetical protein QQM39_43085 [Streptomyces sp. DT2A-34]|uniref:hypothetical protein n=1 Tax=Streptomyces sp. DT2A-34 TaxID=3051182 RepID=UPI00265C0163|nr:hypothetical protein [Streptomyces sp. DT2A-34]MDO0917347.1 hypothetical protein [Streptomyces sp. DT2A-34]
MRLIDARMPELARCLTLFQYVQAVTGGPVARIDQAGSYAVPSLRGEAFAVHPGSIALRVDGDGVASAVVARDEDTGAVALRLLDADGRTVHQGRLLSEGDRLLTGLVGTLDAGAPASGPPAAPQVPAWENGDQLAQLDAILTDGGVARRSAFGGYRGEHRPIEAGVLPAVLDHVCSVGLPIGVAVFAPAAMQACGGRVHVTDRTVGGRVFAAIAQSSVEIDLTGVRSCHLVRSTAAHGPTSALELDDEDGRCVAVITQFGIVGEDVHAAWEHLTASLPAAEPTHPGQQLRIQVNTARRGVT